jgi:hypothetical protein
MQRIKSGFLLLVLFASPGLQGQASTLVPKSESKIATWSDSSPHKNEFITANGIRINYLIGAGLDRHSSSFMV